MLNINIRTIERWEKAYSLCDQRSLRLFTPKNKLTKIEEDEVLAVANSKRFCDLSPSQIVPILADEGHYIASESTFYRLLRKEGQLTHRQKGQPRQHHKPRALIASQINQVWTWDITYLPSQIRGMFFYLYIIVDIYSRKIVGWEVSERETSHIGSECITRAYSQEKIDKEQLSLHSDNGSPMKGATLLGTLQKLGVIASYNRPGVSNDNPYSESLFKTMKYHRFYPRQPFKTISDATQWVAHFVGWYNDEHRHSAIQFVTPDQKHTGQDKNLLAERSKIYDLARHRNPSRWSGEIRNWAPVNMVFLNPDKRRSEGLRQFDSENSVNKKRQLP
jgi:putative transposase